MFCTNCGTDRTAEAKFCHSCGHSFDALPLASQEMVSDHLEGTFKQPDDQGKKELLGGAPKLKIKKEVKSSLVKNPMQGKADRESAEKIEPSTFGGLFKKEKCICNHCDQHLEFDKSMVDTEVPCPSCGMDTQLYIPSISLDAERSIIKARSVPAKIRLNKIYYIPSILIILLIAGSYLYSKFQLAPEIRMSPVTASTKILKLEPHLIYGINISLTENNVVYLAEIWTMNNDEFDLHVFGTDDEFKQSIRDANRKEMAALETKKIIFGWSGIVEDTVRNPKENLFSKILDKAASWDNKTKGHRTEKDIINDMHDQNKIELKTNTFDSYSHRVKYVSHGNSLGGNSSKVKLYNNNENKSVVINDHYVSQLEFTSNVEFYEPTGSNRYVNSNIYSVLKSAVDRTLPVILEQVLRADKEYKNDLKKSDKELEKALKIQESLN